MPPALRIPEIVASAALLAIGVPFLVVAAVSMNRAFNSGRLATSGVFAITRNPIYAAWIILLLPAIAILSGSWPMLLLPVVAYAAFRRTIGNEDKRIEEEFGEEYLRYPSIGAGAVAAGPGYADGHRDR
jgi:protein-S-isoprenylcysteine O-methyltransferase Ste14